MKLLLGSTVLVVRHCPYAYMQFGHQFLALVGFVVVLPLINSCSKRRRRTVSTLGRCSLVAVIATIRHHQLHPVSAVKPFARFWLSQLTIMATQVVTASIAKLHVLSIHGGSVLRHQLLSLPSPSRVGIIDISISLILLFLSLLFRMDHMVGDAQLCPQTNIFMRFLSKGEEAFIVPLPNS